MVLPGASANRAEVALAIIAVAPRPARNMDFGAPSTLPSLSRCSTSTRVAEVTPRRDVGSQATVISVFDEVLRLYPIHTSAVLPVFGSTRSLSAVITSAFTGSTGGAFNSDDLGDQ